MDNEMVIGALFFVLGLIPAYYFYVKSIRVKEPVFSIKSNNVISGYSSKYQYLKVTYKNNKVETFTVSKILFYNRGADTITKQDIETINHLRILGKDQTKLLDAKILQANHTSNNFDIRLEKQPYLEEGLKNYLIEFDYIDKYQGAVIEVIHTGLSSDNIEITGDIRGVNKVVQVLADQMKENKPMEGSVKRNRTAAIWITIIFWGIGFFNPDFLNSLTQSTNSFFRFLGVIIGFIGLLSTFVFIGLLFEYISNLFQDIFLLNNTIPKGLEKFSE